jgi:hypothetical protein
MMGSPRKSTIRLLYPKVVPRSVSSRSSLPEARTFSTTLTMSLGATNWPFLTFTGRPLVAQATIRSVCRQRNAGIWSTSSTWAAGATSETACTSDSTARPVASFTFWRMRRPSVSPGPR